MFCLLKNRIIPILRRSVSSAVVKTVCSLVVMVTLALLIHDNLLKNTRPSSLSTTTAFRSRKVSQPKAPFTSTGGLRLNGVDLTSNLCGVRWLGAPRSVIARNCSTKCDLLMCGNLLSDYSKTPKLKHVLHKQITWFNHKYVQHMTSDLYLSRMKCSALRLKYGYDRTVATETEVDFPLAFNLLVHKDAAQVNRLLSLLYRKHNTYCIHVDEKSPINMRKAIAKLVSCFSNVFQPSRRETIIYAGYSRLQADINCMRNHVESKVKWKYLLNTAGQALPLHTNHDLVRILHTLNGKNDIEAMLSKKIDYRYKKEWVENFKDMTLKRTGHRNPPPPDGLKIVPSNAYASFSRDFVDWVLVNPIALRLLEWCRKTYSPDEHYWATLHHAYMNPGVNAPGSYRGYPNESFISVTANWYPAHECNGAWSSHKICIYNAEDLHQLVYHKKALFANKFDLNLFPAGYECLENWIRFKEECPHKINLGVYGN